MFKIKLYLNTIKYLRISQIYWRLIYLVEDKIGRNKFNSSFKNTIVTPVNFNFVIYNNESYKQNCFNFLNLEKRFNSKIDWNFNEYNKLWLYNLNYFDFLNQKNITKEDGEKLISDHLGSLDSITVGNDPYPISLRLINWVKFNARFQRDISTHEANEYYSQAKHLERNLERHLLGNHFLENGFGLLFASYIFKDEKMYGIAYNIIKTELKEQILGDGMHFELSIMYHQIILNRVLDSLNLVINNSWFQDDLIDILQCNAKEMLNALVASTFSNGDIPHVNDSTNGVAPSTRDIINYASIFDIYPKDVKLSESGYRFVSQKLFELFIDVGKVGPDYIPGHAHADTFNFLIYYKGLPLIVDVGTSTYDKENKQRNIERSTDQHNTVTLFSKNSSNVWGGFRVAERANIVSLIEDNNYISAAHDGYGNENIHRRTWSWTEKSIEIIDSVKPDTYAKAHFHFDDRIIVNIVENIVLLNNSVKIEFTGFEKIRKENYQLAKSFNKQVTSTKVIIEFRGKLISHIHF